MVLERRISAARESLQSSARTLSRNLSLSSAGCSHGRKLMRSWRSSRSRGDSHVSRATTSRQPRHDEPRNHSDGDGGSERGACRRRAGVCARVAARGAGRLGGGRRHAAAPRLQAGEGAVGRVPIS
eukprot:712303-Prymnesium_polylepis.2